MFRHVIRYCCIVSYLVLALPMAAQVEPASFSPSLTSDAVELEHFERFAIELGGSSETPIARLGEQALAMVQAHDIEDAEGFVGAKAVFDLRWARLSAEQVNHVSEIYASMRQDRAELEFLTEAWPGFGHKGGLGFNGGCEAQVICQDNSAIHCKCSTPPQSYGDCYFSVIANSGYPGRVTCNCAGITTTRVCPPPSSGCTASQCNLSCGPPGGICTSSGCVCI